MSVQSEGGELTGPGHLQGVPWFTACTEEQLVEMTRLAERLHIQAGEVIVREGRLGRELFVILDGTATVTRNGRVVNILRTGDYFGELAAIEAVPRSATVHASTDLDVLIVGPRGIRSDDGGPGVPQRAVQRHEPAHPRGGRQVGSIRGRGRSAVGSARGRHRSPLTSGSAQLGGQLRQAVEPQPQS